MEPHTKHAQPVMDVVPRQEQVVAAPPDSAPEPKPSHTIAKTSPKAPPKPKQPRSGVGLAIFGTVVITLGLAALATFAYLKQTNSL